MASASEEFQEKYATHRSGKVKVTILASEWGSSKGGLSTINRTLSIQLAKSSDVEISFFVPQCSEKDKTEALRHNIRIVEATQLVGYEELDLLSFPPDGPKIEVVIGHGVKLGRQAQVIKKSHKCKWVQVVHTDPEEIGMFKCYSDPISRGEEKHNYEVKLCKMADFVVAVGPKLAETFRSYLRFCKNDPTIFDFTPGIFEEFLTVEQVPEEGNYRRVLVFGHGDVKDFKLKGFDIAGKAIASLVDTCLVFVGAPDGKYDVVKESFMQCGLSANHLRVRGYDNSRESLKELFCAVDLVIMPSRTVGFGLTGLKALSAGLPVLVSKNSGFGEALLKVPFCSRFVINSDNPEVWAAAIKNVIWDKDKHCRLDEAQSMRILYNKKYSWTKQSNALRSKIIKLARACLLQLQIDAVAIPAASSQKGTRTEVPSWKPQEVIQEVREPSATREQQTLINTGLATENWKEKSSKVTVEVGSEKIVKERWQDYRKGHLNEMAQEFLVTEELLKEFGLTEFKLTTFISEQEYKACQRFFSGKLNKE
ncbi:D-inositol 3-phosphate glycosyltransferase-like [Montipora capricornis]|uniref:D-inositol 3-phosphate glycosyltransferase-like n=1 Tax=Montipora capricornis TaxID=246305 RepID=UPI0035F1A953